jgi:hypothetical protein
MFKNLLLFYFNINYIWKKRPTLSALCQKINGAHAGSIMQVFLIGLFD